MPAGKDRTRPPQDRRLTPSRSAPLLPLPLYYAILLAVTLLAWRLGGWEERVVASLYWLASLLTVLIIAPLEHRYVSVEWGVMMVDAALFVALTGVALRSTRFWPLWSAGLALTILFAHAAKLISEELVRSYAAGIRFWVYPMLTLLAVGALRHRAARQRV